MTLEEELTQLLNKHSRENESNTPDFILSEYMMACLKAFERASTRCDDWHGVRDQKVISPP